MSEVGMGHAGKVFLGSLINGRNVPLEDVGGNRASRFSTMENTLARDKTAG